MEGFFDAYLIYYNATVILSFLEIPFPVDQSLCLAQVPIDCLVLFLFTHLGSIETEFLHLFNKFFAFNFTSRLHHLLVHLDQVLLLRAQDRAWPRNPDPADEGSGRESEMLHAVEGN